MQKKLVSLLVASSVLATAQVQARVDIFEKDNLTVGLGGDFQVQYRKRTDPDKNAEVEYDDAEIHFFADYDFGNMTAFSRVDLDFKNEINSSVSEDNLDVFKVGLDFGAFKFGAGKLDYVTDDVWAHSYDYEMGGNDAFGPDSGEEILFAEFDMGPAELHLSTDLEQSDDGEPEDESSFDAVLKFDFDPIEVNLAYQDYTDAQEILEGPDGEPTGAFGEAESFDTTGIQLIGDLGAAEAFIAYSTNDAADHIQTGIEFAVADPVDIAFGYEMIDADSGSNADIWYANATYAFNSKVKVFAEIGDEDVDGGESDFGWLTGLRIRF